MATTADHAAPTATRPGADHGPGSMPNTDPQTGIRYGLITHHHVGQAWWDGSQPDYGSIPDEELDEFTEPVAHVVDDAEEGLQAAQEYDSPYIWVFKSKYYTLVRLCSMCFPNAGDLDTPDQDGMAAYCFGPDWFTDTPCPYPVYELGTDKLIYSPPSQ